MSTIQHMKVFIVYLPPTIDQNNFIFAMKTDIKHAKFTTSCFNRGKTQVCASIDLTHRHLVKFHKIEKQIFLCENGLSTVMKTHLN